MRTLDTTRSILVATLAIAVVGSVVGCGNTPAASPEAAATTVSQQQEPPAQPLFAGLGNVRFPVTTDSTEAQRYFNQGLALAYAFNHAAADVAFNQATLSDPDCAMCYWGSALVLGPNVNAVMDPANASRAHALVAKAEQLAATTTPLEQALIAALKTRYQATEPAPEARAELNETYADAMRQVLTTYSSNPNVLALTAEALMDVHPWDFWATDGETRPWTKEITDTLERALTVEPSHIGAIHLYIHAVEQSSTPERAEPYADTLANLAPDAGHLVHMPAHIYLRVGRYHDATLNNIQATVADAAFIQACQSNSPIYLAGYIPHNWHFGWVSAAIEGWKSKAYELAEGTAKSLPPELIRAPGMGVAQHFLMQPTFAQVRFADWTRILETAAPAADLLYARGIWHYARGQAYAGTGQLAAARTELAALQTLVADPAIAELKFFNRDSAKALLDVANEFLTGVVARGAGDLDAAQQALERAVALEDALPYNEPPDWFFPARHALGALLLERDDAPAAERVYLRDLEIMPENGWALRGLVNALRAQDRADDAAAAETRFIAAWANAELALEGSVIAGTSAQATFEVSSVIR